jgi:hypothetical protein
MRCPNCGVESEAGFKFCQRCGYSFDQGTVAPQEGYQQSIKKEDDSSPFLLVAVAVIVALIVGGAVIYAFLVQKTDHVHYNGDTPTAVYSKATVTNGQKIMILAISNAYVPWDDVQIYAGEEGNLIMWQPRSDDLDGGVTITAPYGAVSLGSVSLNLAVTDLAGDGYVSGGDYFIVTADPGFSAATVYTASLLYEPTGDKIGTGITFTG